jgi:hypothetical protein
MVTALWPTLTCSNGLLNIPFLRHKTSYYLLYYKIVSNIDADSYAERHTPFSQNTPISDQILEHIPASFKLSCC